MGETVYDLTIPFTYPKTTNVYEDYVINEFRKTFDGKRGKDNVKVQLVLMMPEM